MLHFFSLIKKRTPRVKLLRDKDKDRVVYIYMDRQKRERSGFNDTINVRKMLA